MKEKPYSLGKVKAGSKQGKWQGHEKIQNQDLVASIIPNKRLWMYASMLSAKRHAWQPLVQKPRGDKHWKQHLRSEFIRGEEMPILEMGSQIELHNR